MFYLTMLNESLDEVMNVNGSSRHKTDQNGKSWKEHWLENTGEEWPSHCCACHKKDKDLVGAHVRRTEGNASREQYIIPLCKECNKRTDKFNVNKKLLVLVDIK